MRVRQSELKTFGTCARQYYYEKVLNLGEQETGSLTAFGTVVHYALEVYEEYDHDLATAKETFDFYWRNPDALGARIDFWHNRTSWEGLQKRGHEMLERYHDTAPYKGGRLVGTEIWFEVPIGSHILTGTIDKLFMRPGKRQLEVWDFKTGSSVPEKLRFNVQFTAYAYATLRPEFWQHVPGFEDGITLFNGWKRYGWWYHARTGKMYSAGYREGLDYQRLLLAVEEMDNAINASVYPLDVYGTACGYCPFVENVCGSETPNPVELSSV